MQKMWVRIYTTCVHTDLHKMADKVPIFSSYMYVCYLLDTGITNAWNVVLDLYYY